jgi:hypothetical protein
MDFGLKRLAYGVDRCLTGNPAALADGIGGRDAS